MRSRRSFLKLLAGLGAFLIPWTVLPQLAKEKIKYLLGRPTANLVLPPKKGEEEEFAQPPAEILAKKALDDIQVLSHPDLQGRRAGTAGETRSLVYLEEELKALNLKAFGKEHYWQMFSIPAMQEKIINGRALFRPDEGDSILIPAANLFAGLAGENQEATVIISAHYDHLGVYRGQLYPGANDNASGVGCVLEVMRRLVQDYLAGNRPRLNIVAAFWGAEEMGYLGSKHFVTNPLIPLSQIQAVINFDTVANGQKKDFILWSTGDSPLIDIMREAVAKNKATMELDSGEGHHSDEVSFRNTGIPAVTLLSKEWLNKNHTPQDDFTLINQEKLETAGAILYDAVRKLAY